MSFASVHHFLKVQFRVPYSFPFQGSGREAGVGAAQVAGQGPGALYRARGEDVSDRRPALLHLQCVVSVGVGGQLLERAVGAVQVHADVVHGSKVRRIGLTLGRMQGQRRGGRREGGVFHCNI